MFCNFSYTAVASSLDDVNISVSSIYLENNCDTMSWIYAHTCIYMCACVCVCIYIYIYANTHVCAHTHTPTHTYTRTYIHTYICGKMSEIRPGYQISNVRKTH